MSWVAVGTAALNIGGSLFGGNSKKKAAKRAMELRLQGLREAMESQRSTGQKTTDFYKDFYSPEVQDIILEAERRMMPQYQQLQFDRMQMLQPELMRLQGLQAEGELDMMEQYGDRYRESLEDPRLAGIADWQMEESRRLSDEAREGLTFDELRAAEQTALGLSEQQGRARDASAIAGSVLGRSEALEGKKLRRESLAAQSRQQALLAAQAAKVDPYALMFGRGPTAYQTAAGLSLGQLGSQVTDPGAAINIGSAEDQLKYQNILGKYGVKGDYETTRGNIQSDMIGSIFGSLGGALGSFGGGGGSFGGGGSSGLFGAGAGSSGYQGLTGFMGQPVGGYQPYSFGF